MKKLVIITLMLLGLAGQAAPGDTTWVYANNVYMDNYNNFDTVVHFPNGSTTYRKILMIFTLGEYVCPGNPTYCHQWDYTVSNYLLTSTDTLELSRFITPYANTGVPRFPSSWKQHYIYDVTDFAPLLKDTATVRINYSGYSGGFTANIKFAFIEGTPERNVLGLKKLWLGSYTFGNSADPIANHIPVQTLTAPANTQSTELKYTVTGHGSDNTTQCCEFASHTYSVSLNGSIIDQKAIWRACGSNELYPQGGTWVFDRGNWCPGDAVNTNTHLLPGVTGNTTYSLGINYDGYTSTGNYGSYTMEGHVVYYDAFNHTLDASLNNIIAPNNFEDFFRENPSGSHPVVKVHNAGTSAINSITFSYGVKDSTAMQYTWNGTLAPQADTAISLAALNTLTNMSLSSVTGIHNFTAKIIAVNGVADEDSTNNSFSSQFIIAPTWPPSIVVRMVTNSEGVTNVGTNPSETSWQILDMNDNVVASRTNANVSTVYSDTIALAANAFYKFVVTDLGCDGLHWWVWDQNTQYGITAGALAIRKLNGTQIPMNGYTYQGTYNNDFGCGFTQYFTTNYALSGINSPGQHNDALSLEAFPNPANHSVTILIDGIADPRGSIELMDAQGRIVLIQHANGVELHINLDNLVPGIYTAIYKDENATPIQKRISVIK
jgi:hypothetical protein